MRVTLICLAFLQDGTGIDWLGRYCERMSARLVVHVDAKVPDAAYQAVAARHPCVTLARTRLPIWWGGFNTVRAAVETIRQAQEAGDSDRYVFLTEDTVPLLKPAAMLQHLQQDTEFIAMNLVPNEAENPIYRRYHDFFFFDSAPTSPRTYDPAQCALRPEHLASLGRVGGLMAKGKSPLPALYHGSGWWALTHEAVSRILRVYDGDGGLRESFEFSAIPEEQYFHTILGHSNWKRPMQPFIHADFTRPPHPYVYRDRAEIEAVQGGPTCMLRKVDLSAPGVRSYMQAMLAD